MTYDRRGAGVRSLGGGERNGVEGRHLRVAENEARFRDANESLRGRFRELGELDGHALPFLCECGDETCTQVVRLQAAEYEDVRAYDARFLIVPGHQMLDSERVVEEHGRYDVVEKKGVAARYVEHDAGTDPSP
jgi:hypothetical protein